MKRNSHAGKALSGGFGATFLSNDELEEIHLATLEVLEHTGVFVEDPEAIELFLNHGAKVNQDDKIVKLQPYMVEEAIGSAPSKLFLAGRNPENDIILESNRVGFTTFGEGVKSGVTVEIVNLPIVGFSGATSTIERDLGQACIALL